MLFVLPDTTEGSKCVEHPLVENPVVTHGWLLSSPHLPSCIWNDSLRLCPPVSTTSVLPCKLHRIACCDVSQLSVLFSSSLLYDRVVRRENAGLLFFLAVVAQITWIARLPKIFQQCRFFFFFHRLPFVSFPSRQVHRDILSNRVRISHVRSWITVIQLNAFYTSW